MKCTLDKSRFMFLHSRLLKHAFLSGVVAARGIPGHEPICGQDLWVEYEPYETDYKRFEEALNEIYQ